jgi:hypothetical protein
MTLELRKQETEAIKALWTDWKADSRSLELETTIRRVDLTGFHDTISRLRSVGLKDVPQAPKLNILMPGGLRFTIVGPGLIQEYCSHGDINKVAYSVLLKERRRVSDKPDQVDLADYGARIKIRREIELNKRDARVVKMLQGWANTPKQFRYIKRYTFNGPADLGMRFDLSIIRESERDSRGDYKRAETLKLADIFRRPLAYEIEAEAERREGTKVNASYTGLLSGLVLILQGIQRSYALVRQPVAQDVIKTVHDATGAPNGKYPGPQLVTINRVNMATIQTEGIPNIRYEDYNVTDKADGLRCLLIVARDGRIYLMDGGRNVYATGLKSEVAELVGTVLDGEWIKNTKSGKAVSIYYAFDIFAAGTLNVAALPFINAESGGKDRHAIMRDVIDKLSTAEPTIEIPSAHKLKISIKTFHSTSTEPGSIFNDVRNCLDAARESDYNTDGLIFTPNLAPLPVGGKTWEAQMKWKPPHDNTIDFLVVFEPSSAANVKWNEEEKKMVEYKTLRLFVAGSMDPLFKDPRSTVLNEKELPQTILDDDTYRPVEFKPMNPSDPFASTCYINVTTEHVDESVTEDSGSSTNIYCTRSKDIIVDKCVVEMAYNPEKEEGWRWEPIRVRWDKTERFQKGNVGALNNDATADNNWYSIHNPISEEMIRTGTLVEKEETSAYYSKKGVKRDNYAIRGLTSFHNETIKYDLLHKTLKKGEALLDLSCGRGGDLWKWFNIGPSWVMGSDINLECLNTPKNGAYGRYLDLKIKQKGRLPPMVFVQAPSTGSLRDGSAGISELDKTILNVLYNNPGSQGLTVPAAVERLRGMAAKQFDVVSCMFAIHYFFSNKDSVDGFLRNVADNLKIGGYFTGCCFDGDSVYRLLSGLRSGGVKYGRDGAKDIWSIKKNYEGGSDEVLAPNDSGLGKAIDVYFMSIGEEHREYLVNWDYLVTRMRDIGCELLQADEIAKMGLRDSSEKFNESYKAVSSKYPISNALQDYSFLNRWFIFRRRSAGSAPAPAAADATAAPAPELVIREEMPELPADLTGPLPAAEPAPLPAAEPVPLPAAAPGLIGGRPVFKFTYNSSFKDDIGIGRKDWARYISTFTRFNLQDLNNPAIIYPSLEAAFASERFKIGSNKPDLGPKLFGFEGNLHQKYLKEAVTSEARKYELLEDEGREIREMIVPTYIKKTLGAKWDETAWLGRRDDIMTAYIKQRYEKDPDFRMILDAIKAKNGILVHHNGSRPSEMGGVVKGDVIDGQNKLGLMYMAAAGFP